MAKEEEVKLYTFVRPGGKEISVNENSLAHAKAQKGWKLKK